MLDQGILNQLKDLFNSLENSIELVYAQTDHKKQNELVEMLKQISETSSKISLSQGENQTKRPQFSIKYNGSLNGIHFDGVPGGHEFTSLVLAILNSDGKGKLPDPALLNRIKRLQGPIALKTYISLSCENCPDVVQALNIMAIAHPDFSHTMVDGGLAQDEVEALNIQGVPSVFADKSMLSSGKTTLAELLNKLEAHYGTNESMPTEPKNLGLFDVVVVGAGPAGASAAVYSARKGLRTVVVAERVGGQLQDTKGIENFISIPYTEGPELSAQLAKHMEEYDIQVLEHRRIASISDGDLKSIALDSGEELKTKSLIVATGAKWRELNIPGEKQHIGMGVAFCPHCDGPYYKGKDIAVVGGGNSGVEAAIDLAGIVKSVTLVEYAEELKADKILVDKLKSLPNVNIITNARSTEVVGDGSKVTALKYEDRESGALKDLELNGIFVQIGLIPNSQFIKDVVETNKFGEIIIDGKCRTSVKGIYAAGDVTTVPYKQIIISMAEGAKAALASFEDHMVS